MKNKRSFLFILAAICGLLISCGKDEISYKYEYMFGTDQQFYMVSNFVVKPKIQETEDGCVLCHDDFIYYYNANSNIFMPLCSKGNCLHDHERDSEKRKACHAFLEDFDGEDVSLMLYRDGLYIAYSRKTTDLAEDRYCVYRIALDGSSKEAIFTSQALINPAVHRGYLYYIRQEYSADPDMLMEQLCFCRRNLENSRHEEEIVFTPEKGHGATAIRAYGKYVYLTTLRKNGAEMITSFYDTEAKTVTDMPSDFRVYTALGGNTFYFGKEGEQGPKDLYRCDFKGENEELVLKDVLQNASLAYDGKYYYLCTMLMDNEEGTDQKKLLVYDQDFKKVDEITVPETDTFIYDSPVGGRNCQYLLFDDQESNEWGLYVWDKSDIGTLNEKSYPQKRICYEQRGKNTQPLEPDRTESASPEKWVIDGVEIPYTQLDQSVSCIFSEMTESRIASLDQWTEAEQDAARSYTEDREGDCSLSIRLTDNMITAELNYNPVVSVEPSSIEIEDEQGQTIVLEIPEYILVGESIEKTISIEGYILKNTEVYKCTMNMTAKNTERPDVFTMQLPEGAEKFIGATSYAKIVHRKEKTTLEEIEQRHPTQMESLSISVNKVYAGRTGRK